MWFKVASEDNLRHKLNKEITIISLISLIKDALVYGKKDADIEIEIASNSWQIRNQGRLKTLNQKMVFARLNKESKNKNSTGLGFAIAKAITDKYGLGLHYTFEG